MFTLKIKTDNEAFTEDDGRVELARILKSVAHWLEENSPNSAGIYDIDGNRVGDWKLTKR